MGYTYESLIDDGVLVQGTSSDITMFSTSMTSDLSGGDWVASYTISEKRGETPIIQRLLPLNDGTEGETPNTYFVHQILPSESSQLPAGMKYDVTIEIKNDSIGYNDEVAQFKLKILTQGVQ
jgi:hypothetical protein